MSEGVNAQSAKARTEAMIAGLESKYQRQSQSLKKAQTSVRELEENLRKADEENRGNKDKIDTAEREKIDAEKKLQVRGVGDGGDVLVS